MVNNINGDPFKALWNEKNTQLNPEQNSLLLRIATKIKNFIFYIPNTIIATCLNPRSETRFTAFSENSENVFFKKIITPDQVPLTAKVSMIEGSDKNTPTVILFNSLSTPFSVHRRLTEELSKKNCNVVAFDYRGLGSTWRAADFVVDGDSIYQYATQELGINKDKVHFYGLSLGGAIAAQVKALHPEATGKYVGDRAFKSIFSLITEKCCIEKLGRVIKKITSFISSIFIAYPVYLLNWEFDGKKALANMKGERRIIYHPHDYLVPYNASLASVSDDVISLDRNQKGPITHFAPIEYQLTEDNQKSIDVVAEFFAD